MSEEYQEVHTDDMALVAYLKLMGHTPTEIRYDVGTLVCKWTFNSLAVADAADFLEDEARVNPRDYTRFFGNAKREMFAAKDKALLGKN